MHLHPSPHDTDHRSPTLGRLWWLFALLVFGVSGCAIIDGLDGPDNEPECITPNLCGGCEVLTQFPGSPCGICDLGTWQCTGDVLTCEDDPGQDALNACGGCEALTGAPGDSCGLCGQGALTCGEDRESLTCVDNATVNACGGCETLDETLLGTACGPCLLDQFACLGNETITCNGETACPDGSALVPAGEFSMGSIAAEPGHRTVEAPRHTVHITRPMAVYVHEVTQDLWEDITASNPSTFANCTEQCPVESINWYQAIAFLNRLSEINNLEPCYFNPDDQTPYDALDAENNLEPLWPKAQSCQGWRLPTEAEWEYLARANTIDSTWGGIITEEDCTPLDPTLNTLSWYCGNSTVAYEGCVDLSSIDGPNCAGPVVVGSETAPNPFGLYDVNGNVQEWVWDWFDPLIYTEEDRHDPTGPMTGTNRVLRGGSWKTTPFLHRNASRGGSDPTLSDNDFGLRPVRTVGILPPTEE